MPAITVVGFIYIQESPPPIPYGMGPIEVDTLLLISLACAVVLVWFLSELDDDDK
jgi:hypothetical protein